MKRVSACRPCLVLVALALTGIAAGGRDLRVVNAAKNAEWTTVRALVKQGVDVTTPQADRTTALHWAAYWDDGDSTDLLIRAGASVGTANDLGVTPLWLAAENGSAAMVRRLLAADANPNAALISGETVLMTAARTGNLDVVKQLLARGADVNAREEARGQTALMWAAAQQHSDVVDALLKYKADVHARSKAWTQTVKTAPEAYNDPDYILDIQQGGYTPLLFAARVGDLASAKVLVGAGANVNDVAPYGTSAIVVAAHSGHGEVAAFLLEKGGDPNAAEAGYTALHAAILHKDEKLVGALLAHGANPNAPVLRSTPTRRDSVDFHLPPAFIGATPFWLAARFSAPKIMRLLAEHGADPLFVQYLAFWGGAPAPVAQLPWVEEGDTTTLMAAAGMGGRSQSPLFATDRLGRLAEDAPVRSTRREPDPVVLEALTLEAIQIAEGLGVDVNAANAEGNTALHAVAARGYDTVVRFLVEKGARLDIKNYNGQTPLGAALAGAPAGLSETAPPRSTPHKSTVDLLRKLGATE